jgi:hypothetical protein
MYNLVATEVAKVWPNAKCEGEVYTEKKGALEVFITPKGKAKS